MDHTFIIDIGKLLFGILILVYSGNYLVKGSVALANHFKISSLVIGLTVVAFGTSAPELIVSFSAAMTGHSEIALGNVIGSNIANIALVLALTVIILPMPVARQTIKRSWPIMFISGLVLYAFMYNGIVSHVEGVIMFVLLVLFIVVSINGAKKYNQPVKIPKPDNKYNLWVYLMMVVAASAGLAIGSRFLVTGASAIASEIGISERIISITIVAFGTSVPEMAASIIAAFKKETDISVGNIIGSNIFNVFAVIGITSGVHTIPLKFGEFRFDLIIMLIFYLLLFFFILPHRSIIKRDKTEANTLYLRIKNISIGRISRVAGIILLVLYIAYIIFIFKS